jgi:hypothetical protein
MRMLEKLHYLPYDHHLFPVSLECWGDAVGKLTGILVCMVVCGDVLAGVGLIS